MKITFYGAAHEVTGSCHLLEVQGKKILIDCGMFQGSNFNEAKNFDPFLFDPRELDAVLVTHAHLDHIGRIPKLVKEGYGKKIYGTKATCEFAELIWQDAYQIMSYNNSKFQEPILFETSDIAAATGLFSCVDYHEELDLGGGVKAVWKDAGHIFGSAFIEISDGKKKVVFSGDIGNIKEPIVKDTENLSPGVDLLISESTYGDRFHESFSARQKMILQLFTEAYKKGGTLMIPAFSIERTQELLYDLNRLSEYDRTLPQMPIFLDSPLAIDAIKVYKRYSEYYDREASQLHALGDDFLNFPQLRLTYTKEQSKEINQVPGPKVVIAGAGMMNGGRILHHALRYLSDPASTLLIIGYQAQGTLGRRLYEGASIVKIFGENVKVKCHIKAVGALSAHGDQQKMLQWFGSGIKPPKQIYFVHGEPHAATELAHRAKDLYGVETFVPEVGESVEI